MSNLYKPIEMLTVGINVGYTGNRDSQRPGLESYPINPGGGKSTLYPYAKLVGENGEALVIPKNYNLNYSSHAGDGLLLDWSYRPLDEYNHSETLVKSNHIKADFDIGLSLFKGIELKMMYGFEQLNENSEANNGQNSFYTRDLVNRFTQISESEVIRPIPVGDIVTFGDNRMISHAGRATLSFSREIGSHEVNIFAGTELSHRSTENVSHGVYGYRKDILAFDYVDYIKSFPIYDGLAGSSFIPKIGRFGGTTRKFVSLFSNASYTYKNKYIGSVSVRKDGSNVFGVSTNQKWNPLWSMGVAWNVHRESFIQDITWLDVLKLRWTYGHSGNLGSGANQYPIMSYSSSGADYTNYKYALITQPPNPGLKWEDVRMINYAVEFSLSRIVHGSFDYFTKKSSDLIASDPIDPTTGFSNAQRNVGEMRSKGWDGYLSFAWKLGKLKGESTVGASYIKNNVTNFKGTIASSSIITNTAGQSLLPLEGYSLYPVFSYRFMGLDLEGNPQGNLEGNMSLDYGKIINDSLQNLVYHGTGLPVKYGFIRNNFRIGDIELFMNISYKKGHYFKKETISYSALFTNWISHGDYAKRWKEAGDENRTTVPSMLYPANASRDAFYAHSEANIEKGDLIRLQDLGMTYRFSLPQFFQKKSIPIVLGVYCNNVGVLWKATQSSQDPDYQNMPPPRMYSVSVKVIL